MNILAFRHFKFDDPGVIASWADYNGHRFIAAEPSYGLREEWLSETDLLIVLGGPMSVCDEARYPWLTAEKRFVERAAERGMNILGICLGAQMLAEVLGGRVFRHSCKEIGWHRIERTEHEHPWLAGMPASFHSFQWHGDTFELPGGALPLAASEGCEQQAFAYGDHIVGLQFHLEATPTCIDDMLSNWGDELGGGGPYIQMPSTIREGIGRSAESHRLLQDLLGQISIHAAPRR